jgi:transglutaminase-like putative cysteine protease
MNQRRHLTVIAAVATLMASAPLTVLFVQWTWMIQAVIVVALICGAALTARALRAPVWAQPLATLLALFLGVTWLNGGGHAYAGFIPSLDTLRHFRTLLESAGTDMSVYAIPVQDRPGFLFITTAGVGICAVLIDLLAVGLRRPALAGLPMLAIYAVPVEIDASSVSLIPFAIGAAGFMWLLVTDNIDRVRLFGRRFTGEGRGVDMWEPSPLASVGRRIAVVGVLLAIIVPLSTPGLTKGLIPQLGTGGGDGSGNGTCRSCPGGSSVNLFANLKGELNETKITLMGTVQTDDPRPGYLRFGVADELTKAGFATTVPSGLPVSQGLPNPPFTDSNGVSAGHVTFTPFRAKVTIQDLSLKLLPIYLAPVTGSLQGVSDSWDFDADNSQIFANRPTVPGQSYTFEYTRPSYDPSDLRTAPALPRSNPIEQTFGSVPISVPEVNSVVAARTKDATNEYDAVSSLYSYFAVKYGFTYQLSTKQGTTGTDIGDFLQKKQGYCVQYASALAWLVRAAGYPARVAFGFTEGSLLPGGTQTYQLTNLNLHAWTEVYFEGFGWVPFDATPAANVPGSIRTTWAPDANGATNPGGDDPKLPHPSVSGSGSSGAAGIGNKPFPIDHPAAGGSLNSTPPWVEWLLITFLVVLVGFLAPAAARIVLRTRRAAADRRTNATGASPGEPWVVVGDSASTTAKRRTHAAWDEFVDTLIDYRVPVDPAETPQATAERVAMSLPDDAAASARLIGAAEQRARYARVPGASEPLDAGLHLVRKSLAARVSLRTRFRARLLPPSVTMRWSAWLVSTIGQSLARTQMARDTTLRMLSIRRLLAGRSAR